jgi:Secretion system C-terminal sorting domain
MKKHLLTFFLVMGFFFSESLFAQPANDNCADAAIVTEGMNQAFENWDATTDGADHAVDCASTGATPAVTYNDIWYSYTATITGQVEWTMCGTASFDTKIYVYDGTAACPPGDDDIITCSEDTGGCAGATSAVVFDAVAGNTYLLRLGAYGNGAPGDFGSGTFNLGEYDPPPGPANNNCANAEVISFVTDFPFTNVGATTDGPAHPNNPCFGFGDNTVQMDIWYSFTAPVTGSAEWSVCNLADFDTRLAVYNAGATCPLSDADLYACNDDGPGCANFTSKVIFDIVQGETYLLRFGGYDGDTGTGTMNLIDIIPPTPPVNDLCTEPSDAYIVTAEQADNFEGFIDGSTIASSFDSDQFIFPKCITNTNGGEFGDVWYTFNTMGNTNLEVRFFSNTNDAEYYFDLWDNCDTTATYPFLMGDCMYFDGTTTLSAWIDTILNLPDVPTDYYIRVITRFTSDIPGDFSFQLVGETPTVNQINELELDDLSFFPNPATDQATLTFGLLENGEVDFDISNILGQQVVYENKGMLSPGNYNFPISLAEFDPGVYFLSIRMEDKVKSLKFIKE